MCRSTDKPSVNLQGLSSFRTQLVIGPTICNGGHRDVIISGVIGPTHVAARERRPRG